MHRAIYHVVAMRLRDLPCVGQAPKRHGLQEGVASKRAWPQRGHSFQEGEGPSLLEEVTSRRRLALFGYVTRMQECIPVIEALHVPLEVHSHSAW